MRETIYVRLRQEHAAWLLLVAGWAMVGMTLWIASASSPWPWEAMRGEAVTLVSLAVVAVAVVLRIPLLSRPKQEAVASYHALWLVGCLASSHWLGFLMMRSAAWIEAVPAMLLIATAEVWVMSRGLRLGALPWLQELGVEFSTSIGTALKVADRVIEPNQSGLPASEPQWLGTACDAGLDSEATRACEPADLESQNLLRRTVDGIDELGRRYLSGEVRVCLQSRQQTESVVIGFVPAFEGEPEVEIECEQEDVSASVVRCTPSGMRIAIRRPRAELAVTFGFQWYAAQLELKDDKPAAVRQWLP